jgi:hypothetical protein
VSCWNILVIVVSIALPGCSTMSMRISRAELQADLARRFPREIDKHVVILRASDPEIDFPGTRDVLGVRVRVEARSPSMRSICAIHA